MTDLIEMGAAEAPEARFYDSRCYEFLLECEEPIAHHSESMGNVSVLMTKDVAQPDGSWARIPYVTGDTMRHGLREAGTYATLDAAGLLRPDMLTESALRLLFAGGKIRTKEERKKAGKRTDDKTVHLDDYRHMCEVFPPLRLLGGCTNGRAVPGQMDVGEATLVCSESLRFVPQWVREYVCNAGWEVQSHRAHVELVDRVRMDPMLSPEKRLLLTEGERARVEGRLLTGEAAADEGDSDTADDAKCSMLPRSFERIKQGSLLFWRVSARVYSDVDLATLHVMLAAFLRQAKVGGKRATGHGLLRLVATQRGKTLRPAEAIDSVDIGQYARAAGDIYVAHCRQHHDALAAFLAEVEA